MIKDIRLSDIIAIIDIFLSFLLIPVIKLVLDLKLSLERDKVLIERILDDIEELKDELKEVKHGSQTHRD
jgi:hypothetical protein